MTQPEYLIRQQRRLINISDNTLQKDLQNMMLNRLPSDTSMSDILDFIEQKSPRHGARDRCLYSIRQQLRLSDIANLSVASVINPDASVRKFIVGPDGKKFTLPAPTQNELKRYLQSRFSVKSLEELTPEQTSLSLLPTQKKPFFSPNTLAQHLSYLDRDVRACFEATQKSHQQANQASHSDTSTTGKKTLLSRLTAAIR